jgi:outer membrane protein OmpA-like peptidoglycan-associated protein
MAPEVLYMKILPIVSLAAVILAASGCATKSYVQKSIDPVNGKLDSQGQQITQTSQSLQKTQQSLEADETTLSATKETASAADARAGDALNKAGQANDKATEAGNKADQANQRADQVGQQVGDLKNDLKNQFASLDDYKKVSSTTVNFKFNSDKLDADAKQALDQMASSGNNYKRYFIAVEGFTDKTGDEAYNEALSRRRADAVVAYLVSQHDIPVYRIQMIGLGKDKPVDDGKTREARAKNRRVEVTIYSADPGSSPMAMN